MSAISYSNLLLQQQLKTRKIASTLTRSSLLQRTLLSLACCFVIFLLFFEYAGHKSVLALAQTTTYKSPVIKNEQYTSTNGDQLLTISTGLSTFQPITTTIATTTLPYNQSSSNQQQPKSLKFTLIAGKFWKFQIKSNSFTSHKEGELRLHKNVSLNNYIIDDESWFQYNPKQQLLFAWPNLYIKPGIYQFVLLPSGIDFEADSENTVNLDIAANIVVELIRPLYPSYSNDIEQYIDYKFSLDYLHRHSTYPLLLNQITAVFETLSSLQTTTINKNNNYKQSNEHQVNLNSSILQTTTTEQTKSSSSLLEKLKGLKPTNKLAEFLLINQTYSSDGEFFSLTWTTQPSLINNTITQIQDCRLGTITDIITKLSNISSGYQNGEDKYTLYYPLEATAALSTQAIVSTDRGQHLLKLNLNGPCRRSKVLDDLGIVTINSNSERSLNNTPTTIVPTFDVEDKENNNSIDSIVTSNKNNTQTSHPGLPEPEAIDSNTATVIQEPSTTIATTSTTTKTTPSSKESGTITIELISANLGTEDAAVNELVVDKVNKTTLEAQQVDKSRNSDSNNTNDVTTVETSTLSTDKLKELQTTKNQPQAKSFANFLDANDSPSTTSTSTQQAVPTTTVISTVTQFEQPSIILGSTTSATAPMQNTSFSTKMPDTNLSNNNNESTMSSVAITPTSSESSLNEDFLGILNNAMDYLVSIAVPASIIVGSILIFSILIALCHLFMKRKKSKQFQVRNRFKFRYGSERRGFLKNSSKPVILDADRKSLSCGGTPIHHQQVKNASNFNDKTNNKDPVTYLQMRPISSGDPIPTYSTTTPEQP